MKLVYAMAVGLVIVMFMGAAWGQLATLTAPDPSAGASVLLVSQGAALGAPQANDGTGAVYLYQVPQGGWNGQQTPQETLLAPDGMPGDLFGQAMATAGSQLIVGAPGANSGAGAIYVYVNLVLTQEITMPGEPGCALGSSLSTNLSDPAKFFAGQPTCGWATLFEYANGQWQVTSQLMPAKTVAIGYGEPLGYLTLAGGYPQGGGAMGYIIMGGSTGSGRVNGDAEDFGSVISMQQSSNLLFVGEPAEGKVLVYFAANHEGHAWWNGNGVLVATLTDSSLEPNSGFGSSISARGKDMIIGAPGAGVVDLFIQQPGQWASSDSPQQRWAGAGGAAVAVEVGKAAQFVSAGAGVGYVEGAQ